MNIGDAALQSTLPAKTIRYYEDIELVPPERSANECRSLLSLYQDSNRASADVKALAISKIEEIDRKIAELGSLRRTLNALAEKCHGDSKPDCPIIDDLAGTRDPVQ